MEERKITVVDSSKQKKISFMSSAETLGELRRELSRYGIEGEEKTFLEGYSHTEMRLDSAILPSKVTKRDGTETNELVFMVTQPEKKIKSGSDRQELYAEISKRGAQEAIKEIFGKNFTQVSNAALASFLSENKCTSKCPAKCDSENSLEEAIEYVHNLIKFGGITPDNGAHLLHLLGKGQNDKDSLSDEEIDEMFADMP